MDLVIKSWTLSPRRVFLLPLQSILLGNAKEDIFENLTVTISDKTLSFYQ